MTDVKDPKNVVPQVDNMLDLQFNPKVDKTAKIKEQDIFDPEVAKKAKIKAMASMDKTAQNIKAGKKIKARHNSSY